MVALGVAAWILPRSAQFAGRGSEGLLMAAGAGVVLAAWAMVVVTYALHYAHQDSGRAQLDFPVRPGAEAQPPSFGDYAYFSIAVSTTFGTTDVTVTSTRMRRTVMGHTLVAFVFATVILGLLVSLLVR